MNLIIDFFLIGGMVVNAIILLLLFNKHQKDLPQKLLILFFALLLLFMLHKYADLHNLRGLYMSTFIFNDVIELLIGPLIYLYIKSLFENPKTLWRNNWFHFIPLFIYIVVISIPILISVVKNEFVFNYLEVINNNNEVFFIQLMLYLIVYLILSLRQFYKYQTIMASNFSTLSEDDFGWVKHMLIGALIVCGIDLTTTIISIVLNLKTSLNFITMLLIVIFIVYLGYYGVKQSKVLLPDFLLQPSKNNTLNQTTHTQNIISAQDANKYIKTLEQVMQTNKAYLNEDLTLSTLAQAIGITDKKLSFLLNNYMNTSFYDYVNTYRIASVKEKMNSTEYNKLTLLAIAYDSGFKSKTSFNRVFKKETGMSPSEYKKSL